MTRDHFLGFGCSATTLLKNQFKINTFSTEEYCKRIDGGNLPTSLTIRFSLRQRMVYYLFWTVYSTKVDAAAFERFFGVPLKKAYGWEMTMAKVLGFVTEEHGIYQMTLKGTFYYYYYENFYTLPISTKCGASCGRKLFRKKSCYKKRTSVCIRRSFYNDVGCSPYSHSSRRCKGWNSTRQTTKLPIQWVTSKRSPDVQ